jgi:hypothetical protein
MISCDNDAPLTAMQMALVRDHLTGPDRERLKDAQTARDGGTRPRRAAARLGDGHYAGGRYGGSNRGQCGVERGDRDAPDTSGEPCSGEPWSTAAAEAETPGRTGTISALDTDDPDQRPVRQQRRGPPVGQRNGQRIARGAMDSDYSCNGLQLQWTTAAMDYSCNLDGGGGSEAG